MVLYCQDKGSVNIENDIILNESIEQEENMKLIADQL